LVGAEGIPNASVPGSVGGETKGNVRVPVGNSLLGVNPLIIGGGALGISFIIIALSALFLRGRKQNKAQQLKNVSEANEAPNVPSEQVAPQTASFISNQPVNEVMEVVFEYEANLFDELTLSKI
jgi:hypothetical protein